MCVWWRVQSAIGASRLRLAVLGLFVLGVASCSSSDRTALDMQSNLDPGWPKGREPWVETSPQTVVPVSWIDEKASWPPTPMVPVPEIPDATVVGMDEFCETCHETYAKAFAGNVHREQGCEKCHGGASIHLETRGREPETILSLRPSGFGTSAGRSIQPAERSEVCLECHEQGSALSPEDPRLAISTWRISAHSHQAIACTDCHRAHYSVPPGTPILEEVEETAWVDPLAEVSSAGLNPAALMRVQEESLDAPPSVTTKSLAAVSPDICYPCHADMRRMEEIVHPHQIGVPLDFPCTSCHDPPPRGLPHVVANHPTEFNCTTCHDPHGNILAETRKDLCLKCHGGAHMGRWYSSPHAAAGVACTDCHNPHSQTGPPMHVDQPRACYRCHDDKRDLELVAHPHQVLGPNGFNCTTCHDPHGKVVEATRKDQCLECHDGAPTMAWHSSTHHREGVACADCHNPHPRAEVPRMANVSHTAIKRPGRLPMSVDEPEACFKCHPKIYAFSALPSHHPIAEGKMVCSDCHDAHGQARGHLKEATVNEVCYECHAEKEGPFAYEHAPVTENCAYCHEPHGTVENNLLRQPTTFLCLRCHSGHSTHGQSEQCFRCHFVGPDLTNVGGGPLDPTIATTPTTRRALFTDCTQCHTQIHGSDLPSGFECFGRLER